MAVVLGSIGVMVGYFLPYVVLAVLVVKNPRKYFKIDFVALYILILFFFGITFLFHPEYEYFYTRETYGIWDHVLKPYRGIYAYLFIRLIGEPEQILKCMRI